MKLGIGPGIEISTVGCVFFLGQLMVDASEIPAFSTSFFWMVLKTP